MATFRLQTLLIPFLLLFPIFLYKFLSCITNKKKLPPSPPKLPIIGNLHQLGKLPHRSLYTLSRKYGDLMLLHFGSKPVLIVSSAKAAEEITKTHDLIFANRPKMRVTSKLFYDGRDIAFGPYSTYWRHVRSITVLHFLSSKRVQSFRAIREQEVSSMVEKIRHHGCNTPINIGDVFITLVKDGVCRASLGKKYEADFDRLFKEFTEVTGAISIGDFIPWLGWIDRISGLEGRTEKLGKDFDVFLERIVQDKLNNTSAVHGVDKKDNDDAKHFVTVLVQLHKDSPADLPLESVKALLFDVFAGAIETSYTLLEWAMTEIIRHPTVMKLLRDDIVKNVKDKTRVAEDDLENMKYLDAVIKETLRVHPPVCILPFREASDTVKINGYEFSCRTQVLINTWAIQRDPDYWEDPEEFKPERFLNRMFEFKGQDTNYIPFGAGRRGCPGISYGLATTKLALASLIYEFDWKMPDGFALDVEESNGLTVRRKHPLMLIATSCNSSI